MYQPKSDTPTFDKTDLETPRVIQFWCRGKWEGIWKGAFDKALLSIWNMRNCYAGEPTDFQIVKA